MMGKVFLMLLLRMMNNVSVRNKSKWQKSWVGCSSKLPRQFIIFFQYPIKSDTIMNTTKNWHIKCAICNISCKLNNLYFTELAQFT